jgi:hypothetical protein
VVFVGIGYSFESYYQAVRRCWRFGQERPVHVTIVTSEAEGRVLEVLRRKLAAADEMATAMAAETAGLVREAVGSTKRVAKGYRPTAKIVWPEWLKEEAS